MMNNYQKVVLSLRALQLLNVLIWAGIAYLAYGIHPNLGIIMLLYVGDIFVKKLFHDIQNDWSNQ